MDGVRRQRLGEKRFGVFDCTPVAGHQLTEIDRRPAGAISHASLSMELSTRAAVDVIRLSHSHITRSSASVDAFVKQRKSLFVFFQGHPEYESETLLLEYRRDLKRFLTRESEIYPTMPQGYFDDGTLTALTALRDRAFSYRCESLMADFPTVQATNTWRRGAVHFYHHWLEYLARHKDREPQAHVEAKQLTIR